VARQVHVEIVSVEERVWAGEADMLVARTTVGELGVMPGHAPLLGQLAEPSQVRVKLPGGGEQAYDVSGGFLSVTEDGVTVLAEDCAQSATAQPAAH
jgi:F-type H+-transporting ATPase subunit epsilon